MFNISERFIINTLYSIIAVLLLLLVSGTIVCFSLNKDKIGLNYRASDPEPQKVINMSLKSDDKVDAYTNLGQLRVLTKSPDGKSSGTTVIVSPWFSYPQGDKTFFEELATKERMQKSIIADFFSNYTEKELRSMGEIQIKEKLCELLNEQFVLGQIKSIYFNDYLFIK